MAQRSIDPVAVQAQLRRLLRQQQRTPDGPWLHAEVARRMGERLALIRHRPRQLVEWWGGLGASEAVLRERYPDARRTVVEPDAAWADWTRQARQAPWWSARRWRSEPDTVCTEGQGLPPAAHGLVWANMAVHAAADPPAWFARWHDALEVDGFVMFSCLGPGSLAGLRTAYAALGLAMPAAEFIDMHDLGDMLLAAGFADPVMDQERLTLTWSTPEALLDELRSLGGNVAPQRFAGLHGRGWRRQLLARLEALRGPDGRLTLDFEVAYGHAFKLRPRLAVAPTTTISLAEMREQVRSPRARNPSGGDAGSELR